MSLAANLARIHQQMADACRRAHRPDSGVALMAVSKMHPAEAMIEAYAAGQRLFGENRVQEWQEKLSVLQSLFSSSPSAEDPCAQDPLTAQVHLIGPLQSNKTGKAAELFDAIDAVDSLKIATRLNAAALTLSKKLPILIEVKLSHEESKHGILPAELPTLLAALAPLESLVPCGLMTVPPWSQSEDAETARPYFRELRRLRDASLPACPTLTQLSMGMSNDFAVAIEEGSTCVRIGTAIFGKRRYPPAAPAQE
jgi:pyridoxal phosphate enzyme (YggS family)